MELKRILAKDMRTAQEKATALYGPDVLVISSCQVRGQTEMIVAVDVVPMQHGKPVWSASAPVWQRVGKLGEEAGLEWAGRWKRFREFPHFQHPQAKAIKSSVN